MLNPRPGNVRPRLLIAILLLALAGCAYYNTFYLARRYYKEAQREQDKSVSDAISMQAATKYEQVVRQCNKVITEYPKSKWVDDATYLLGASLYGKGDYSGAIKRLDELEVKFPKSPFVPEARLVKGLAHYRRKDYDSADSILQALDAAYPKFSRRWELYFYEGENRAAQRDYGSALSWYRRAVEVAGARRERADALRREGDALFEADRLDSAQLVFAQTLKVEERPKQRLDVALKRGAALRDLKRYPEALVFLNEWRSPALTEDREGELLLRIYEIDGLLGRTNEALKGYGDLVTRFPNTNVSFESQFQIGYLYESALGDLDRAAREYEKLRAAAGSTNTFAVQAVRRSQSLTTLKQYRQALAADTSSTKARTAFRLAEVYYFELGKTDSALTQYRTVESLYPASVYAPKSAYARLWISAYDRHDTLGTMQLTDSIASQYRGTRYAESALYLWKQWSGRTDARTVLFDSLLAHPDTSSASRYAEDTQPETPPASVMPPTSAPPDSGYSVSPEVRKRLEEAGAAAQLEAMNRKRALHGKPPLTSIQQPAPADTTAPAPGPAPADTTRATQAPPDTTRSAPAPADTTRSAPAPADTTRSKLYGPTR